MDDHPVKERKGKLPPNAKTTKPKRHSKPKTVKGADDLDETTQAYVESEVDKIWQALECKNSFNVANDEDQYKLMGLDKVGVKNMKKMGKEEIRKKFLDHTIQRMNNEISNPEDDAEKYPEKKKSSNLCFFLFMFAFLAFLVASKMNEETLSLFGMNSKKDQVVRYHKSRITTNYCR